MPLMDRQALILALKDAVAALERAIAAVGEPETIGSKAPARGEPLPDENIARLANPGANAAVSAMMFERVTP